MDRSGSGKIRYWPYDLVMFLPYSILRRSNEWWKAEKGRNCLALKIISHVQWMYHYPSVMLFPACNNCLVLKCPYTATQCWNYILLFHFPPLYSSIGHYALSLRGDALHWSRQKHSFYFKMLLLLSRKPINTLIHSIYTILHWEVFWKQVLPSSKMFVVMQIQKPFISRTYIW